MARGHHAVTERPARCPTHPGDLLRDIPAGVVRTVTGQALEPRKKIAGWH
jgi:hypothetical protein